MAKTGKFENKVILITGASRGIGRTLAASFAEEGAQVIANYNRSEEDARSLEKDLKKKGYKIEVMRADIGSKEEIEKMMAEISEKYGRVDVLVNNAGLRRDVYLAMMSEEDWDQVQNVNLKGVYHTCKWVSRMMIGQRGGKIINISSVSALKGVAGQTNYSASKGGMISFTKSLALELAPYGIQVNAIAPGFIETDMVKDLEDKRPAFLEKIPLGRFGVPEDVSGGVLFLASEDSDYITGFVLAIDGGLT
jgi:3-oxoacyl-[acyl-carrier protein] reductase